MKYLFFLLLITNCGLQLCQPMVTLEWARRYDGIVGGSDSPYAMSLDDSGNVYVTGRSRGLHYLDIVTIKYDRTGLLKWSARYDGGDDDGGYGIVIDRLGNVYVTGYTWVVGHSADYCTIKYNSLGIQQWIKTYDNSNRSDVANNIILDDSGYAYVSGWIETGMYNYDFCTIKYDANGNVKWLSTYEGPAHSSDIITRLTKDNIGNIIVIGESAGIYTNYDYCTIKYNQITGDTIWVERYNGQANDVDHPSDVEVDSSGNIYVTGWSTKDTTLDIFTIKYSPSGNVVWTARYNGVPYGGEDRAYALKMDSQNNIYIAGRSVVSANNFDCILIKYDNYGVEKWVRTYGGLANFYDAFLRVDVDIYDNVYTTGYVATSINSYPYDYNFITTKHNQNGQLMWMQIYGDTANRSDEASLLSVDKDLNVYVAGEVDISYNNYDYCTLRYSQPTGIKWNYEDVPGNFSLSQNYPNPFNPLTTINYDLPFTSFVKLIIYDILGREISVLVNQKLQPGTYEVEWDASNYPSGVYFYKLTMGDYTETKKMILSK